MCNTSCGRIPNNIIKQILNDAVADRVVDFNEAIEEVNDIAESVTVTSNLQTIARIFNVPIVDVAYLTVGQSAENIIFLFDPVSQITWRNPGNNGKIISWEIQDSELVLVTSVGTYTLQKSVVLTSESENLNLDYGTL